jgi:hypothetical protein
MVLQAVIPSTFVSAGRLQARGARKDTRRFDFLHVSLGPFTFPPRHKPYIPLQTAQKNAGSGKFN